MPEEEVAQEATETEAETQSFDADYVKGLRAEAADWRTKLRDAEKRVEALAAKVKAHEDSQKSELERLTDEKARLESEVTARDRQLAEMVVKTAVTSEATRMGIIDPDAAYALIDMNLLDVDGASVKGVKKALERLIKDRPYLIEQTPPPPTPGLGGQPVKGPKAKNIDDMFYNLLKNAKPGLRQEE